MALTSRPPRGPLRFLLRAPILGYRARLGFLFGHRLAYLVHTGRKSGRRREVVLEVVRYAPGEIVVVAGWGTRSDWFRNLEAAPAVKVQSGFNTWTAPAHQLLDEAETLHLLEDYRSRHPRAWKRLAPILGVPEDPRSGGDALTRLRAVAFHPS
ncbi:nitroreductase family deazaflavin-dependent oxidoreductase [Amycolatopsis lurida]